MPMRNRISMGRSRFNFLNMTDNNIKAGREDETGFKCPDCGKELSIEDLLRKYGPEGLYDIAEKLKMAADEDVSDAMGESDALILHYYLSGFRDETWGTSKVATYSSYVLKRAYELGVKHAIEGKEVPPFTDSELLKMIKNI